MTEDELIDEMAMEMFPTAWDADHDDPHDDGQVSKKYARFKARAALTDMRQAIADAAYIASANPATMRALVAHIRRLQAENDTRDALRMQGEAQVASLLVEIARLKQLVDFADALRAAQRAYMADRGNDQLGRAVVLGEEIYDDLRSLGGVRSDE
jgi:hypothetical protein